MCWTQPLADFIALSRVPRVVVITSDSTVSCDAMSAACAIAFAARSGQQHDRSRELVVPRVHRLVNADPDDALIARVDLLLISGALPREIETRGAVRWLARRARVVRVVEASGDRTIDMSSVTRPATGLPVKRIQMVHASVRDVACAMFVESRAGREGGLVVEAAVTLDEQG